MPACREARLWPRPVGALVPGLTRAAFRRRAPSATQVLADWATIVGPALAARDGAAPPAGRHAVGGLRRAGRDGVAAPRERTDWPHQRDISAARRGAAAVRAGTARRRLRPPPQPAPSPREAGGGGAGGRGPAAGRTSRRPRLPRRRGACRIPRPSPAKRDRQRLPADGPDALLQPLACPAAAARPPRRRGRARRPRNPGRGGARPRQAPTPASR